METIKLKEGLEIRGKMSVILWDRVSLLYKKYNRGEIGEAELTLEAVRKLLIPGSSEKIIDDIYKSDMSEEIVKELLEWMSIISKIVDGHADAKKKPKKSEEDTKE